MTNPKLSARVKRHMTHLPLDAANLLRRGSIIYRGSSAYTREGNRLYTIEKSRAWANYRTPNAWLLVSDVYIDDYIITGETWKVWY